MIPKSLIKISHIARMTSRADDELASLITQRDMCRAYADDAGNPATAERFLTMADDYDRRITALRVIQRISN